MCGIAGIYRRTDDAIPRLGQLIDNLLLAINSRGGDATGLAAFTDDGYIVCQKAAVQAWDFTRGRRTVPSDARSVLLHTRLATQGSQNWPENNHPVEFDGAYVVHNGHIWNDSELFTKHSCARVAQVDSEALPMALRACGFDKAEEALESIEGAAALAAVDSDDPTRLLLARGEGSPLSYLVTHKFVVWASTTEALLQAYGRTYGTAPAAGRVKEMTQGKTLRLDGRDLRSRDFALPVRRPVVPYVPYNANRPLVSSALKIASAPICELPALLPGGTADTNGNGAWSETPDLFIACDDCGDYFLADEIGDYAESKLCAVCLDWIERALANYDGKVKQWDA